MYNAPICPIHQIEARWKPPGVSRSNKPYDGFWGCPQKDNGQFCKSTFQGIPGPNGEMTESRPRATPRQPAQSSGAGKQILESLNRLEAKIDQLLAARIPQTTGFARPETPSQQGAQAVPPKADPASVGYGAEDEIRIEDIPF